MHGLYRAASIPVAWPSALRPDSAKARRRDVRAFAKKGDRFASVAVYPATAPYVPGVNAV